METRCSTRLHLTAGRRAIPLPTTRRRFGPASEIRLEHWPDSGSTGSIASCFRQSDCKRGASLAGPNVGVDPAPADHCVVDPTERQWCWLYRAVTPRSEATTLSSACSPRQSVSGTYSKGAFKRASLSRWCTRDWAARVEDRPMSGPASRHPSVADAVADFRCSAPGWRFARPRHGALRRRGNRAPTCPIDQETDRGANLLQGGNNE